MRKAIEDFKLLRQVRSEWCWASVTAAIVNNLQGKKLTQENVVRRVKGKLVNETCTIPDAWRPFLCLRKRQIGKPLAFGKIAHEIHQKRPVSVVVQWKEKGGRNAGFHVVAISGYAISARGLQLVLIDDPFLGRRMVPYSVFADQYHFLGHVVATYFAKRRLRGKGK